MILSNFLFLLILFGTGGGEISGSEGGDGSDGGGGADISDGGRGWWWLSGKCLAEIMFQINLP